MLKKGIFLFFLVLFPLNGYAQNNGISLGYGFGMFNTGGGLGEIENDRNYHFIRGSYFHEFFLVRSLFFVTEPYLAYVSEPKDGVEVGLSLFFRYYLGKLFFNLGGGVAYTGEKFEEQGTHYVFIIQGGLGYNVWKNFFIEYRFRHYSNGGLASPNHSVNAGIVSAGFRF